MWQPPGLSPFCSAPLSHRGAVLPWEPLSPIELAPGMMFSFKKGKAHRFIWRTAGRARLILAVASSLVDSVSDTADNEALRMLCADVLAD